MSFYVTLPSNSSKEMYPEKTLTKYTTKLKNPIKLEGSYELALVEVIAPINWQYRETGSMIVQAGNNVVRHDVKFNVFDKLSDLLINIRKFFETSPISLEIQYDTDTRNVLFALPGMTNMRFLNVIKKEFSF